MAGQTGTYLLDLSVTRTQASGVVENTEMSRKLAVYPNPAKEFVTLDWSALSGEVVAVRLLSLDGRMPGAEVQPGSGATTCRLPVAGLAAGIYFVELQTTAGTVLQKILVEK